MSRKKDSNLSFLKLTLLRTSHTGCQNTETINPNLLTSITWVTSCIQSCDAMCYFQFVSTELPYWHSTFLIVELTVMQYVTQRKKKNTRKFTEIISSNIGHALPYKSVVVVDNDCEPATITTTWQFPLTWHSH